MFTKDNMPKPDVKKVHGLHGFVKNGITYIKTDEVAQHILGGNTYKKHMSKYPKGTVRWSSFNRKFNKTLDSLGIKQEDIEISNIEKASSKRGLKSKYEIAMPQFLPDFVINNMAVGMCNDKAVNTLKSIVNEFKDIYNANDEKSVNLNINITNGQEIVCNINTTKSVIVDNDTINLTIGFDDIKPLVEAYNKREDFIKANTLDSQSKHLKEVVRFEDPNKNK